MRASWLKRRASGICFSVLLGLGWATTPTLAWQFRDLDQSGGESGVTSPSDATDLVPTKEAFVAPVVDADEAAETKAAATEKPDQVKQQDPAPTTTPTAEPVAESAAAAKTNAEPTPQPVPMPELGTTQSVLATPKPPLRQPEPLDGNPMKAFGQPTAGLDAPQPHRDIHAAKFNNLQPGVTKLTELKQLWGEPLKVVNEDGESRTLIYKVPSFQQVDVRLADDTVSSITVHLAAPLPVDHVVEELKLTEFAPVPVPDEFGEVLGQAYPERGLMFNFTDDLHALRVSAILLEPISGEMFRLRAEHDFDHQYLRSLADLDEAIRLNPEDAESYWLQSELQDAVGRTRDAVKSVQKAVRLAPTNPVYRLTRARLYGKFNQHRIAIDETRAVLTEIEMPNEVAARANCLLGDLLAIGPHADHQEAMKHHLKAIDFATKAVDDQRFAVRRMAKHALIDAHLSVARDVTLGNFQRQIEVVPKWLLRATELADEYISDDQGDELLQMSILRNTLAAYVELQGNFDAAIASEEALRTGRAMIVEADDMLYKIQIERLLAETLMHSAKIERTRGRYDSAMTYANNALALLNDTKDQWQTTTHDRYLEGELYFLVGSLYAVEQEDHAEAVEWYTKARDIMVDNDLVSPLYTQRGHGEMLVSMGLSFWESGEHETAMQLTVAGAELMKQAVEMGSLQVEALAVPYGNLATMHGKMGQQEKSEEFAQLVAKLEKTRKSSRR